MRKKQQKRELDFKPVGTAIKNAREIKGLSRDAVAEHVDLEPRYYAKIEDNGQHPSLNKFYAIVKMLHVSVDEFFLSNIRPEKTTKRRYIESLLDHLSDKELKILEGTIKGILNFKESN